MSISTYSDQNNSLNDSYIQLSISNWLELFGSTYLHDFLYTYILTATSLTGFLLNLLSFCILLKKKFDKIPIFHYLRLYTLNSSIICLFLSSTFLGITYRLYEFTSAYQVYYYGFYVFVPFYSTFYMFNSFIDVYISLERLSLFLPKLKKLNSFSWKPTCLIMFFASVIINIPIFFIFDKASFSLILNDIEVHKIWSFILSDFALSFIGKVAQYVVFSIRDVLTMGFEIFINVLTIILMKKHFNLKKKFIRNISENQESTGNGISNNISNSEKNLVKMIAIICLLSILQHIFFVTCTTYFTLYHNDVSMYLSYASYQITAIKHLCNFFIFISFNNLFRKGCKNFFKRNQVISIQE